MNSRIIKALYQKEIIDILRDKKTILMMIVVPLILYPLIFIGSMALTSSIVNESTSKAFSIGFDHIEGENQLKDFFVESGKQHDYSFNFVTTEDYEKALENGAIKAYLQNSISDNGIDYYKVYYDASNNTSSTVATMIQTVLRDYKNTKSAELIENAGLDAEYILQPLVVSMNNIASSEKTVGNLFGYILPFLLISSVLMGAMYPAIDVTSGEKERGTLETLLTLPVSNLELILSKFFATSTIAVGAAFLNVFSMGVLGLYFYKSMDAVKTEDMNFVFDASLYIPAVLATLVVAIIFAMFSSAVCLSVCIFARSFKEAQNYTTPVMLVFMFAGMVTMIPSLELNGKTALIPVVNFALLIADLFKFDYNISLIVNVIAINLAYCVLAVLFMAKAFSSENILFGDSANGIHIIEKRSDMKEKSIPGVGDILLLLSFLLIILLMAGSLLVLKLGIYGAILQQLTILIFTLLYCWYIKTDLKKVFWLKRPKLIHLIAGFITMAGAYLLVTVGSNIFAYFFPESAAGTDSKYMTIFGNENFIIVFIAMAIMPAICEEIAFRGFLFGTLVNRYKLWTAIIVSGVIFGAYHMSLGQLIFASLLGGLMAYVIYKTKSIFISMLMHCFNNGVSALIMFYPEKVEKAFPILAEEFISGRQIAQIIVVGIILLSLGLVIINKTTKNRKNIENEE